MDILSQNKCSSLGMLFGAIALILGIFHFSFGPFSAPPPTLESVVSEKVSAVKNGILAGLKGEKASAAVEKPATDIDKILDNSGMALAVIALVCAFIGGMRKENRWVFVVRCALVAERSPFTPCFLVLELSAPSSCLF